MSLATTPEGPRATVLLVEDDEGIRETVADSLRFEGYDVAIATNGAEALAWIEAGGVPSMVLLDLVMPVMDGAELLQRLRSRGATAQVPVVVMTAALGAEPATEAAEAVLAKPFDLGDLLALVEKFSARRA